MPETPTDAPAQAVTELDVPVQRTAAEVAGLDALELAEGAPRESGLRRIWSQTWPKIAAIAIVIGFWQFLIVIEWRPPENLPGPGPVFGALIDNVTTQEFWRAIWLTLKRGLVGYGLAAGVGLLLGVAVARVAVLRAAIGSIITGLQTMPSIAWFPLAILLYQREGAIMLVVVLGAAPSVANGVISGIDYVSPVLLKAAANLGAKGWRLYWYVVLPASLPSIVSGLKQGWAFAWRSLMAGELLVVIAGQPSIGAQLQFARVEAHPDFLIMWMIVILIIGIVVDILFNKLNNIIRRRWGVLESSS